MKIQLKILFYFFPVLIIGQNHISEKTQKEVSELISGNWKMTSWTFEGTEKINPDKIFGESIFIKNDSLKLTELIYKNEKKEIIESNIDAKVEKYTSGFFLCVDYTYKVYCRQIMFVDESKLILEQGPDIYTYKKIHE